MENAIWNEKLYTAAEIAESYELEKNIRKASGRKELRCVDSDCRSPILRYCHGEKKCAFFAHLDNCTCDYAEFDKENTPIMRQVKRTICDNFKSRGFDVQIEVKLLPRHYTHLLFAMTDGKKIAVELGTQRTTANQVDRLVEQYRNIGVDAKWIVISNFQTPVKENETFFIKRYLLNESNKKDILILNWSGTDITQYVVDPNEYFYSGKRIVLDGYSDIYSETSSLSTLIFEDEELTIEGFYSRYQEWLNEKKKCFDEKIAQTKINSQNQSSSRDIYNPNSKYGYNPYSQNSYPESSNSTFTCSYNYKGNALKTDATSFIGNKRVRCESCGFEGTTKDFWTWTGNLGECYKCRDAKRVKGPMN